MELNWKFLLVLFVFTTLCLSPLFFREWPPGTDPYWTAKNLENGIKPPGYPPGFFLLMGFLPWHPIYMTIYPILMTFFLALEAGFLTQYFITNHGDGTYEPKPPDSTRKQGKVAKFIKPLLQKHPGWLASFLVFGFPVFIFRNGFFEEDLLGMVFALAGVYFVAKCFYEDKQEGSHLFLAAMFFFIAVSIWRGAVFFVLLSGLAGLLKQRKRELLLFLLVGTVLAGIYTMDMNGVPVPNLKVSEALPGVIYLVPGLLFGLLGVYSLRFMDWFQRIYAGGFFLLACYMARFCFLSVPFLAFGMVLFLRAARPDKAAFVVNVFMVSGVIVGLGWLFIVVPSAELMEDLSVAIELSGGEAIANEWRFGHWINYLGGNAEFSPLYNADDIPGSNASWVLGDCSMVFEMGVSQDLVTGGVSTWREAVLAGNFSRSGFCLFHRHRLPVR